MAYYVGVDVGTGSVRAAVVRKESNLLKVVNTSIAPITIWNETVNHYEQSSEEIWKAVVSTVTDVLRLSSVSSKEIKGIGFDATCSLVALDMDYNPVCVSVSSTQPVKSDLQLQPTNHRNVIMWMDHRATQEANLINATKHPILEFVGGAVSVEMEMPKVLWIKKNLPTTWRNIGSLMDLPDFLTYKATGNASRSLCSLVCKWAYDAGKGSLSDHGWNDDFLTEIGLADLTEDGYDKLGQVVNAPGQPVGKGLTEIAAAQLGLLAGTPVGTSLIDAHAGGVGMLICKPTGLDNDAIQLENKLGLICGTSSCHMIVSDKPAYIPGVWGPYYSAMVPEMWLNEGGQSATGKLIDHILESHPAFHKLKHEEDYFSTLSSLIAKVAKKRGESEYQLTKDLHVYPDFHGNRSPLADANMKGMICGLTLSSSLDDLAILYLATLQSLVYGTLTIVDEMQMKGYNITTVYMCGGLTKNTLFVQMHSDILNMPVVVSEEPESVLVGSALLGVCASERMSLTEILNSVQCDGVVYQPNSISQQYHKRKYSVFKKMRADQIEYDHYMDEN